MSPVASFTEEVNHWLAKHPLVFNGRLSDCGLTPLVKEATGSHCWGYMNWHRAMQLNFLIWSLGICRSLQVFDLRMSCSCLASSAPSSPTAFNNSAEILKAAGEEGSELTRQLRGCFELWCDPSRQGWELHWHSEPLSGQGWSWSPWPWQLSQFQAHRSNHEAAGTGAGLLHL